jgi:hypothetical protein
LADLCFLGAVAFLRALLACPITHTSPRFNARHVRNYRILRFVGRHRRGSICLSRKRRFFIALSCFTTSFHPFSWSHLPRAPQVPCPHLECYPTPDRSILLGCRLYAYGLDFCRSFSSNLLDERVRCSSGQCIPIVWRTSLIELRRNG